MTQAKLKEPVIAKIDDKEYNNYLIPGVVLYKTKIIEPGKPPAAYPDSPSRFEVQFAVEKKHADTVEVLHQLARRIRGKKPGSDFSAADMQTACVRTLEEYFRLNDPKKDEGEKDEIHNNIRNWEENYVPFAFRAGLPLNMSKQRPSMQKLVDGKPVQVRWENELTTGARVGIYVDILETFWPAKGHSFDLKLRCVVDLKSRAPVSPLPRSKGMADLTPEQRQQIIEEVSNSNTSFDISDDLTSLIGDEEENHGGLEL